MPTSFTRRNPSPQPSCSQPFSLVRASEPHRFSPDKAQAHYVCHLSCTSNIYHLREWFSSLPNNLTSFILYNFWYNFHSAYVSIIISTADTGWIFAQLKCGITTNTHCPQPDHAAAGHTALPCRQLSASEGSQLDVQGHRPFAQQSDQAPFPQSAQPEPDQSWLGITKITDLHKRGVSASACHLPLWGSCHQHCLASSPNLSNWRHRVVFLALFNTQLLNSMT